MGPHPSLYQRRDFLGVMAGGAAALLGCGLKSADDFTLGSARIDARPGTPFKSVSPGDLPLGLGSPRDGVLHVPPSYQPSTPMPLVLGLHGATQNSTQPMRALSALADEFGFLLLAVDSRDTTWDAMTRKFGPDIAFIESALAQTFDRCNVARSRVILEGFSDGASYALGMGLVNGDLFGHLIAFSPGFIPEADPGSSVKPSIYLSHGLGDTILPIDKTSRVIVQGLQRDMYTVSYHEFDGGHQIPPDIARDAVKWMMA